MHRRNASSPKANSLTETWTLTLVISLSVLVTLVGMQNLYRYSRMTSDLMLEVWSQRYSRSHLG